MKTLIAYSSLTGNTKKIANAIYEKMQNADLLNIDDVQTFDCYDLIFLGGWIDRGIFNEEVNKRLKDIKNKNIAFFFTLGAFPTSTHAYKCVQNIKQTLLDNNNNVLGHYHCMGAIDKNLREKMYKFPKDHPHYPNEERLKRWEISDNHPNEEDIFGAIDFTVSILNQYKKVGTNV